MADASPKYRPLEGIQPMPVGGLRTIAGLKSLGPAGRDLDDEKQDKFRHVSSNTKFVTRVHKRVLQSLTQIKHARDHILTLPKRGEVYHLVLGGNYPLWAMVPAIADVAGCDIVELQLVTLGFSADNVAHLTEMLDAGRVRNVHLLCSHYFKHASADIYDPTVEVLRERGQRIHAVRNHAKMINAKLADGRTVTVESSANLRSCKNIETATVESDAGLYRFHRAWILDLFP